MHNLTDFTVEEFDRSRVAQRAGALEPGCEEMKRKWRENEEMERKGRERESEEMVRERK